AVDTRSHQREFVRVDHRVVVGHACVAVPERARLEIPALLLELDDWGLAALPLPIADVMRMFRAGYGHGVGDEGVEEPALLGVPAVLRIVLSEFTQLLAGLYGAFD